MSPSLKAHLALESLDPRVVPATYSWLGTYSSAATNPMNWQGPSQYSPPPGANDDVYFNQSAPDCIGLGGSVASLHILSGFGGTVSLGGSLTVGIYEQSAAALSQPADTNLTVTGTFTWTGGVLNNTPSNATVNILGGGTITPPTNGALSTGSVLNFGSSDGTDKTTTIGGDGNISLTNSVEAAIRVQLKAKVEVKVEQGFDGIGFKCLQAAKNKVLELNGGELGYYGEGKRTDELRVVNSGGTFYVGKAGLDGGKNITVTLTHGDADKFLYTQSGANTKLRIYGSCTLDANTNKGVENAGGSVIVVLNPRIDGADVQVATIKGKFAMSGGAIGFEFPSRTGFDNDNKPYFKRGTFKVDGDVAWSGGAFVPGVDAIGGNAGNAGKENDTDKWTITGKLTITAPNADAAANPKIVPTPQRLPQGQQAKGTWNVIVWGTLDGNDPAGGNGVTVNKKADKMRFNVTK